MDFLQSPELTYSVRNPAGEIVFSKIKDDQITEFGYRFAIKYSLKIFQRGSIEEFLRESPTEVVVANLEYSEHRAIAKARRDTATEFGQATGQRVVGQVKMHQSGEVIPSHLQQSVSCCHNLTGPASCERPARNWRREVFSSSVHELAGAAKEISSRTARPRNGMGTLVLHLLYVKCLGNNVKMLRVDFSNLLSGVLALAAPRHRGRGWRYHRRPPVTHSTGHRLRDEMHHQALLFTL
ncbi:hypothetical protein U9M48_025675 [Paspalum notatum var. saurae]|uniref:Uncharacterized protein n=1 Tax=Paspalum notatum var. saurae TaxID=547442 RepID=A0AAQ3WY64_PASNO